MLSAPPKAKYYPLVFARYQQNVSTLLLYHNCNSKSNLKYNNSVPESEVKRMAQKRKVKYEPWMQESPQDKHFFRMYDGMIFSDAYSQLSNNAKAIYNLLRANLYDSGRTAKCPYNDIQKYAGVSRGSIRNCIDELTTLGFIKVYEEKTNSKKGVGKPSNIYEFIDTWKTIDIEQAKAIKKELKRQRTADAEKKAKSHQRIEEMKAKKEQEKEQIFNNK